MKKMMMALAALCVVGAASAVTMKWDSNNLNTISEGRSQTISNVDYSKTVTVTFSFTVAEGADFITGVNSGKGNRADYLWLGLNGAAVWTENKAIELRNAPAYNVENNVAKDPFMSVLVIKDSNNISTGKFNQTTGTNAYAAGDHTITLTITNGGKTVSVQLDDLGAASYTNNDMTNNGTLTVAVNSGTNSVPEDVTISGVTVEYSVPEPTALALLALGVAGLALRRRAA